MKIVKLELTRLVAGALLAITFSCGGEAATKFQDVVWCRVEPSWLSSAQNKLDLQALLGRHVQAPRKLSVRRQVVATVAAPEHPSTVAVLGATRVRRALAKDIEVASCSGGHASILCPGYQLIGFEY